VVSLLLVFRLVILSTPLSAVSLLKTYSYGCDVTKRLCTPCFVCQSTLGESGHEEFTPTEEKETRIPTPIFLTTIAFLFTPTMHYYHTYLTATKRKRKPLAFPFHNTHRIANDTTEDTTQHTLTHYYQSLHALTVTIFWFPFDQVALVFFSGATHPHCKRVKTLILTVCVSPVLLSHNISSL
jgi:hypothetical protein